MTLIAGFKTSDGAVICADSQETLGLPLPDDDYAEYRVLVDKIQPQRVGNYDLIIGGSGNGPLAEGFTEALADQLETWDAGLDGGALKDKIRNIVLDYHRHEVALCPVRDKHIEFLVCLKQKDNPAAEVHLWVIRGTAINRVSKYALIGWEEAIYRHDIDRHYRDIEKSLFAMLVGVHVLMLARETSNHVGGPINIISATRDGLRMVASQDAAELEKRIAEFDTKLDALRLRISDTAVPLPDFNRSLSEFQESLLDLRLTLTSNILLAKLNRLFEVKSEADLGVFYDPYVSIPSFEESTQAFEDAWRFVVANRQTKRGLVTATHRLSQIAHATVEMLSRIYKAKAITYEQKNDFAGRALEINESGLWAIEQQRSGQGQTNEQIAAIYSHLTDKVVSPFVLLMKDFGKLGDEDEKARRLVQEFFAAVISVFTWAVLSPVSEPPKLANDSAPKQLGSDSDKPLT